MKSHTMPLICGVAVAAMCAAGASHWWSVRQFSLAMNDTVPAARPLSVQTPPPAVAAVEPAVKTAAVPVRPAAPPPAEQQKFYDALLSRMEGLQHQNRDLLDQLAETNRDLMNLEFRVDSHSASFRPLPVSEDQPFTSLDSDIGVLPPRAEPVLMLNQE
jgi:hypothetical protein